MSLTQFAMVEELAFLVKDNLPCKHLILSMEEALINFLQDNSTSNRVLELEPSNAYNRLLLHRLAEIFGFSHHSVGEGDDRHLVLERNSETTIPEILVCDLLWQFDEVESPRIPDVLLRKKEASPVPSRSGIELPSFEFSLEEREAAYIVARERIYSVNEYERRGPVKQRPPINPIVARRMITHALGQSKVKPKEENSVSSSSMSKRNESKKKGDNFKEEHIGAAKRMFANALGIHPISKANEIKQIKKLSGE